MKKELYYPLTFLLWFIVTTTVKAQTEQFCIDTLNQVVFERMQGKSFPAGCSVQRSDLRYLTLTHYNACGEIKTGEMVCNKAIAKDLIDIFKELFRQHYPIERIQLIDEYDANDERSMRANNTSCFCYRVVEGSKTLSNHALGLAVDLNPLYNPCVRHKKDGTLLVQPETGKPFVSRTRTFIYKITHKDLAYRLFKKHGFKWGGDWNTVKDYQHFEKVTR